MQEEIKGLLYDEEKIQEVLNLLNVIKVSGYEQIKSMSDMFDILTHPIPFKASEAELIDLPAGSKVIPSTSSQKEETDIE